MYSEVELFFHKYFCHNQLYHCHHARVVLLRSRPRKRYKGYCVQVTLDLKSCTYFCSSSVSFTDGQCLSCYYSLNHATLIDLGRVYLMGSVQSPAIITGTILSCLSLICFPIQSLFLSWLVSSSHGPLVTSDSVVVTLH